MTGFSDLSNELILEILRHVAPRDLDAACTITKSISLLVAPILTEHRRLKQQFSSCNIFHDKNEALFKLLVEILAKPRNALYVRSLIMDFNEPEYSNYGNSLEQPRLDSNSVQLISRAIEKTGIIPADELEEQIRGIQINADVQCSLALLLLHLPDLNSLEISFSTDTTQYICKTTHAIQYAPAGTCLLHLKHVSIDCSAIGYETEDWAGFDVMRLLDALLELPSLASCYVEGLNTRDEDFEIESIGCSQIFNIRELTFFDCAIGAKTLFQMLRKTQNLESFRVIFSGARLSESFRLDWYWLGIGLLHHAKHSLKKLQLQSNGLDILGSVCSLRELEMLQEIYTDLSVFPHDWAGKSIDFGELLPASIQKIHLSALVSPLTSYKGASRKLEQVREAVLSILNVQETLLPQLTEVCVLTGHRWEGSDVASVFADASKVCHSQGISFKLE